MTSENFIKRQAGFGLLESLIGLLVFVLLIFVGAKAYHNVVANHKKAAQLKSLTDAVAMTAEKMASMSVNVLIDPKAGYTTWSEPQDAGLGDYVYKYRIVPKPSIGGSTDSNVVGLELQSGTLVQGVFKLERSFATLIAPHLSSKDRFGKSSTLTEREEEASFYASLRQKLANVAKQVIPENQKLLNSYSCYNPSECCGFMKDYFMDPTLTANDGLMEKCLYRCALAGNVRIDAWNDACKTDFCSTAPWKTSADCCKAIAAGQCPNGSVCASVCYDCVHEDGSGCAAPGPPICVTESRFVEFFNCQTLTFCDGSPLPDGDIPGWGNVKSLCQTKACQDLKSECGTETVRQCCDSYWETLLRGDVPEDQDKVCARISKQSDCCDIDIDRGYWDLTCTTSGTVDASSYNGKTYCGSSPFNTSMERFCTLYKGCPGEYGGTNKSGTGGCRAWTGSKLSGLDQNPDHPNSGSNNNHSNSNGNNQNSNNSNGNDSRPPKKNFPVLSAPGSVIRDPSNRNGKPIFGVGGRE